MHSILLLQNQMICQLGNTEQGSAVHYNLMLFVAGTVFYNLGFMENKEENRNKLFS